MAKESRERLQGNEEKEKSVGSPAMSGEHSKEGVANPVTGCPVTIIRLKIPTGLSDAVIFADSSDSHCGWNRGWLAGGKTEHHHFQESQLQGKGQQRNLEPV